jgi:uncharacterized membrane protein YcaP (DUF421 family)
MDRVLLGEVNWKALFVPSLPVAEIVVRGSITYLAIFILMRIVPKRETGSIGTADLLLVVLIADAAQNAMADNYSSITDGVILITTIIFWSYFLDWLSFHFPAFRRLIQPQPLLLIKEGRLFKRNMRKELITREELLGELREQGVEDFSDVKEARIEEDGHISVIKRNPANRS